MIEHNAKGLNNLVKTIREEVALMGFETSDVPLRIALIHSEVSEAFEAFRNDKFAYMALPEKVSMEAMDTETFIPNFKEDVKDTFEDEIADSIIRLLDLCGEMGIDIEFHIEQKMRFNKTRGYRFGGKKF